MYLFGSSLVTGGGTDAKQDSWFCMILSLILVIPILWMHTAILELYPGRDYFHNIIQACGKIVGKIIVLLISLYSINLGALVVRISAEFLHASSLTESPLILLSTLVLFCFVIIIKRGIYVCARLSKFLLPFTLFTLYATVILSVKEMDWSNLKPYLDSGTKPILKGTLLLFTLPLGELVIIGPIFQYLSKKEKIFSNYLKGVLVAFPLLLLANLRNTLTLGYSSNIFAFPSYSSVSEIALGDFFTRIEVLIGVDLLLAGFFKISILIFTGCDGLVKIFKLDDYQPIIAPAAALVLFLSIINHNNTEEMYQNLKYLPIYSLFFQVLLPFVVLITGKIKSRLQKNRSNKSPLSGKVSSKAEQKPGIRNDQREDFT